MEIFVRRHRQGKKKGVRSKKINEEEKKQAPTTSTSTSCRLSPRCVQRRSPASAASFLSIPTQNVTSEAKSATCLSRTQKDRGERGTDESRRQAQSMVGPHEEKNNRSATTTTTADKRHSEKRGKKKRDPSRIHSPLARSLRLILTSKYSMETLPVPLSSQSPSGLRRYTLTRCILDSVRERKKKKN